MGARLIQARRHLAEMRVRADSNMGDIVRIYGGIGADRPVQGDQVALAITAADQRHPLAVLIDSPGGIVADARRIVDAIENRKGPTWTYAISVCASGAALVFAAGHQRWAEASSVFNLHYCERVDRSHVDRLTEVELRKAADHLKNLDAWMLGFLHSRTRHPSALLRQMLGDDRLLDADQAKLMGLVTHRLPGNVPAAAESMKRITAPDVNPPDTPSPQLRATQGSTNPSSSPPFWSAFGASVHGRVLGLAPSRLTQMLIERGW